MSGYDKHNKRNKMKEVVDRYVNFVLLASSEKLEYFEKGADPNVALHNP